MHPRDRVQVVVDRSNPEDPTGGTVGFTVNGAAVWGGRVAAVRLGYTEDDVVVVSMLKPLAVQIVE